MDDKVPDTLSEWLSQNNGDVLSLVLCFIVFSLAVTIAVRTDRLSVRLASLAVAAVYGKWVCRMARCLLITLSEYAFTKYQRRQAKEKQNPLR